MPYPSYDTVLETEEFITAEEYVKRRERGEIDPKDVRIVPADINTGSFGGFMVKLKIPRYRAPITPMMIERTLEEFVKYFGVPEGILRNHEEVAAIQQARSEAENKHL